MWYLAIGSALALANVAGDVAADYAKAERFLPWNADRYVSNGTIRPHWIGTDDAFWYVINGAVKFYGEGDKLIGEFKKGEGILIPRGFQYWFESSASEPLEILRVTAKDQNVENKRVNYTPLKTWQLEPGRAGA